MLNELDQLELNELQGMETENEESQERFKITDEGQLNWALRKIAALEKEQARIKQVAGQEIERLQDWQQQETRRIANQRAFFDGLILIYAAEQKEENPAFKTLKTPYGKIGYRKQPDKWKLDDDGKPLISYLLESGRAELVRTKQEVNRADLKKMFHVKQGRAVDAETGEVLPGVTIEEGPEVLEIKPEK